MDNPTQYDDDRKRALRAYVLQHLPAADLTRVDRVLAAIAWDETRPDYDDVRKPTGGRKWDDLWVWASVLPADLAGPEADLVAEWHDCDIRQAAGRAPSVYRLAAIREDGEWEEVGPSPFEEWDRNWCRAHAPQEVAR